jgi:hypothetical protein
MSKSAAVHFRAASRKLQPAVPVRSVQVRDPPKRASIGTGQLVPRGKTPQDHRYTAVVMPLSLARNRFGFMWVEMGPRDWEIYVRIRNLVSSALLRTMLVQQREQAQQEVERLLSEARERAAELAIAKEWAERTAAENANCIPANSRVASGGGAAKSSRQLSSPLHRGRGPAADRGAVIPGVKNDRCALFLEDVNGDPAPASAPRGFRKMPLLKS